MSTFHLAFVKCVELIDKLGVRNINALPGCWEHALDDRWTIAFNGHDEPTLCSYSSVPVPAYSIYVQYNGWPAGIISPNGGIMAAGGCANEDALIAAVEARL